MIKGSYKAKYPVQTVEKAIDILIFLKNNGSSKGLTLNEISDGVNIGKSSVHRFLDTFLEYDLVEKSDDGIYYKLSWGAFELGSDVPKFNGMDSEKITSYLNELSNYFGEIINLGIKSGNYMVIIKRCFPDKTSGNHKLITNVNIGEREPLHCTGIGKLFLSEMEKEEALSIFNLQKDLGMTEMSIRDKDKFLSEIEQVKKNGYAIDDRESADDVFCIAVPLRDYTGKITAGISISVPAGRIIGDDIQKASLKMIDSALMISKSIGYVES